MILRVVWREATGAEAVEDAKSQSCPDAGEDEPRGDKSKAKKKKINKLLLTHGSHILGEIIDDLF